MIFRLLFRVLLVATALQAPGWREVGVDARPAGAVASGAGEAGLGVADTAGVLQRGAPRLLDDLRWDPAQPRRIGKGLRDRRFHPGPGAGSASLARVHSSTHATHAAPAHAGVAYTLVAARAGMISSHTNGLPPPLQG